MLHIPRLRRNVIPVWRIGERRALRRIVMFGAVIAALVVGCYGLPVQAGQGMGWAGAIAGAASLAFARPGSRVRIPAVAVERLGTPGVQGAELVQPWVAGRIRRVAEAVLPCWSPWMSEVVVLRQPEQASSHVAEAARAGFMTGITALEKRDEGRPYSADNLRLKLYFFLPADVLDGAGLEQRLRGASVIPYAAAPVPHTYGEFLEWTVAHELWHVVDFQARLGHLLGSAQGGDGDFDRIVQDPVLWAGEFQGTPVSELLGWQDYAQQYSQSDELARPLRVRRGATTYQQGRGAIGVEYADGTYAFARPLVRAGYLPGVLQRLDDLAPLVQSGKYPTLYALFNSDVERFADYGAWYAFARLKDKGESFWRMDSRLGAYYAGWWGATRAACDRQVLGWAGPVAPLADTSVAANQPAGSARKRAAHSGAARRRAAAASRSGVVKPSVNQW